MKVKVGISVRHAHLTKEIYGKLFGDTNLKKKNDLDQPGQYASNSVITIKNGDREIKNVRIVGPLREYNQIEISKTDSFTLKVNPPIKASGEIRGSSPITLVGPIGEVDLKEGLILANRHIHITKEEKEEHFKDVDNVCIKVNGEKGGVMENVYLKIKDPAAFVLHLDTDDGNAFNIKTGDEVEIVKAKKEK